MKTRSNAKAIRIRNWLFILILLVVILCTGLISHVLNLNTIKGNRYEHNHNASPLVSNTDKLNTIEITERSVSSILEEPFKFQPTINSTGKESIIYIGIPGVFLLIELYPEENFINVTKIPHTTLILNNTYKLSQMFLKFGAEPFVQIVKKEFHQEIDYYFVQSKYTFIGMIDAIGGVDINVDSAYAKEKNLRAEKTNLSGSLTYDYISFLKAPDYARKSDFGTKQTYHTKRHERQVRTAKAIYEKFSINNGIKIAIGLISSIQNNNIESNINQYNLLKWVKNYNNPLISYHVLPGNYEHHGGQIVFIADTTGSEVIKTKTFRLGDIKQSSFSY